MTSAGESVGLLQNRGAEQSEASIAVPPWLGGGVLVEANGKDLSALKWLESHETWLRSAMHTRGAVLLRGFGTLSVDEFADIATLAGGGEKPQPYENRSTPRKTVKG